jgi:hypothetical protein
VLWRGWCGRLDRGRGKVVLVRKKGGEDAGAYLAKGDTVIPQVAIGCH